jgi:hypothetical protein
MHGLRDERDRQDRPAPAVSRWLAQLPYALVVCGVVAGLFLVALNYYRRGSALLAVAALGGALARLLLPDRQVGLLATRRKTTDVLIMVAFAIGIAAVAWVVRSPR